MPDRGPTDRLTPRQLIAVSTAAALVGLAVGGCGGSSGSSSASGSATHATGPVVRTIAGPGAAPSTPYKLPAGDLGSAAISPFGQVVIDHQGRVVYVFERDQRRHVTCTSSCQEMWTPVAAPRGAATVSDLVKRSLLASAANPNGGRVLTYDGWPLYTYSASTSTGLVTEPAGNTSGQRLNSHGGRWYMISPTGAIITKSGNPGAGVSYPSGIPGE